MTQRASNQENSLPTSNEQTLSERLRDCVKVTFSAGLHGVESDCRQAAEELDRQRAEIERLTRERDEARSASVPGSAAVFAAVEAERDQLREALKRISEPEYNATVVHDGDTWVEWLQRIAKEALSGAPESASETGNDPGVILKELWSVCRVVFYPDMGDLRGDYPIEHAPGAGKDARALIEARLAERVLQRARTTQKAKGDQK